MLLSTLIQEISLSTMWWLMQRDGQLVSVKTSDKKCMGGPAVLQVLTKIHGTYEREDIKKVKAGDLESCGKLISGMKGAP